MTSFFNKKWVSIAYPWVVCMIPVLFLLYCCIIKSGAFVDEYYSYGFANSSKGNSLLEMFDGNLVERVIVREDLDSYILADSDEAFSYGYITDNCANNLTPPLYFCVLHTICSFFPNVFSKWFGLSINIVAFGTTLILLYHITELLFHSRWVSTLVAICYGFSMGGLNCATYIRMYAMVTLWTSMLIFFIIRVIQEDKKRDIVAVGVSVCLGFLTQYNFGFPAFFLCAATCVVLLCQHKIKKMFIFSAGALSGVLVFLIIWPEIFSQVGKNLMWKETNKTDARIGVFLVVWLILVGREMVTQICIFAVLLLAIFFMKLILREKKEGRTVCVGYIVILSGFVLGTLCIAYFSPFYVSRYCYITMPLFSLLLGLPFYIFQKKLTLILESRNINLNINIVGALFVMATLFEAMRFDDMDYLYVENTEKQQITEQISSYPCLFFNTNYDKSITDAIEYLRLFDEFYVADPQSQDYQAYLDSCSEKDRIVVFVDTDPIVSSGLDWEPIISSVLECGGYDSVIGLFTLDSSAVFLLYNESSTVQEAE